MLISVAVFVGVCSSYIHFLERRRLVMAPLAVNSIASWKVGTLSLFVFRNDHSIVVCVVCHF